MRILKIELQNINSLRSESPIIINFELPRFTDAGLFAITGATGAGKTTLLDAITIALYRRVPRFEKSGNNRAGLEDVVSYGSTSAMARVTFEAQNQRYEAHWDIRLTDKRGKKLSKPFETVRLKNLTEGSITAETKTGCDEQIVAVTRLNYDQFLRSVMLAQGEFAAFLTAKSSEKGLLLQQIAGDDIYRRIGEALKNRIADEKRKLEQIKSKINTDDLLSHETIEQFKLEEQQIHTDLKQCKLMLTQTEAGLKRFADLHQLQVQQQNLAPEKTRLEADKTTLHPTLLLLEKHEAAEPFKANLIELLRIEKEIQQKNTLSDELTAAQQRVVIQANIMHDKEMADKQALATAEKETADWLPKLDAVSGLDAGIESLKNQLQEQAQTLTTITEEQNKLVETNEQQRIQQNELLDKNKKLELYFEQHSSLSTIEAYHNQWISSLTERAFNHERIMELHKLQEKNTLNMQQNNTLLKEYDSNRVVQKAKAEACIEEIKGLQQLLDQSKPETLLQQQQSLTAKRIQLDSWLTLSTEYRRLTTEKNTLDEKVTTLGNEQKQAAERAATLKKELETQIVSVNDARELYEKDRYIVSLENERQKLQAGEACPLCGSTDHPLIQTYTATILSDSEKRLKERQANLEKLRETNTATQVELAQLNTAFQQLAELKTGNEINRKKIADTLAAAATHFQPEDKTAPEAALVATEKESKALQERIALAQNQQKLKDEKQKELALVEAAIKNSEVQLSALRSRNEELAKQLDSSRHESEKLQQINEEYARKLRSEFADCDLQLPAPEQTAALLRHLQELIKQYAENKTAQSEIEKQLARFVEIQKSTTDKVDAKANERLKCELKIKALKNTLLLQNEQRNRLLPADIRTEQKRTELLARTEEVKKMLEKTRADFNSIKEQHTKLETALANTKKELADSRLLHTQNSAHLDQKTSGTPFSNRDALMAALLPDETRNRLLQERKKLDERTTALATLEKKLANDCENLLKSIPPEETAEQLTHTSKQLNDQNNDLQKRLGELAESFRKDKEIRQRNALIVDEINNQERVYRKWSGLMAVLGGSQEAFNTYVQRLTLKNLIDKANLHLYKLNKRYSLQLNPQYKLGEELNFKLVDHYLADEMRLVDTSSGGEKFLISLALALGLSDLASQQVRIGSLFIDEGFGTLDSNTLETVISTLETLKAQGKMIGIISHVDSLKERIPVQIQVVKKSNGVSLVAIS